MSLLQSIFMGLIQGLTEFLPVSSSGHLALFKALFHVQTDTGIMFDVLLHLGTLVAIFAVYYKDIWELICEGVSIVIDFLANVGIAIGNLSSSRKKKYRKMVDTPYRRFVMLIIVSTIPTGIMGVLGQNLIEAASATVLVPGICLIITSILLFISDRVKTGKDRRKRKLWQCGCDRRMSGLCYTSGLIPLRNNDHGMSFERLRSHFRSKILLYHVHSGSAWGSRFGTEGFESCNNSIF